jgi:RecA/RadA recombinase
MVTEGDSAGERVVAIEEFDTRADLDSFLASQPLDGEAQATIAATFAPVGPFTVVDMVVVDELTTD